MKFARLATPLAATTLALCLGACSSIGPDAVRGQRVAYNLAVQETNDQELLLNLVRLRYRDSLYFLSVERVAATLELNSSLAAGVSIPESGNRTFGLGPGSVALNDKPTIFYTPVEGERFTRQLMKPLDPELLLLLANSGWSLERVMVLGLLEMNGLPNAPTASGPTPAVAPRYREFREAARALRELQQQGLVTLGRLPGSADNTVLELRFKPECQNSAAAQRFRSLLGLNPALDAYRVVPGFGRGDGSTVLFAPRSLMAMLSYISQGVVAPAADVKAGRVTQTVDEQGQPFDWQQVLGGLLRVSSSRSRPADAAVSINYRDQWFYVADNDLESKSTFALLSQLFALQAGSSAVQGTSVGFSINR